MHYTRGRIKLEIGLAKGKKQHDKREAEKDRDWKREQQRLLRHALMVNSRRAVTLKREQLCGEHRARAPQEERRRDRASSFEKEAGCVVCGVDEVGCAPLAGPVVAAAVILPAEGLPRKLARSSTTARSCPRPSARRPRRRCPSYCVISFGEASVEEIDTLNIYHARMLAMRRAIAGLERRARSSR